jgi:predicted AAA+ superfamily ATPase
LPVSDLWVFDELHEYRSWRGYLKGLYDRRAEGQRILVTGSARLDLDRHGGDSLQGRYHYLRLHPLSAAELSARSSEPLESLLALGPFPEPFLSGSARLAQVPDEAARFENLVASHLLKWIHREEDLEGRDLELRYFRDVDGREVDFVVLERRTPILFVECKLTSTPLDPGLRYLVERFPRVPAWQIALRGDRDAKTPEGVRLAPAWKLLATLA